MQAGRGCTHCQSVCLPSWAAGSTQHQTALTGRKGGAAGAFAAARRAPGSVLVLRQGTQSRHGPDGLWKMNPQGQWQAVGCPHAPASQARLPQLGFPFTEV